MTETKKKEMGKIVIGLSVLVVILAVSNAYFYTTLQNQISQLNTTYQNYVTTHSHSNSEYDSLLSTYNTLVNASLLGTVISTDRLVTGGTDEHWVTGIIVNYGNETARDVHVILKWYKSEELIFKVAVTVNDILGKSFRSIDITYYFEGIPDSFSYDIEWI